MITTHNLRTPDQPHRVGSQSGFTLIELLIALVITGILASVAMPAYKSYGERTRRTDAKVTLTNAAQILERCMIEYDAYNNASCSSDLASGTSIVTPEGYYTIKPTVITATTFTLTASPVTGKAQADDDGCTSFTLNQAGAQGATGTQSGYCW